jgi:hypothetical protein
MARSVAILGSLLVGLSLAACGDDDEKEGASAPDLVADVRLLQDAITNDPALAPLEDVDEAVSDDLPARASELVEAGALPAARRQVDLLEGLELTTPEGRRLKRKLLDAYRDRVGALEGYRDALARGPVEDLVLVDAMEALRQTDQAVMDVDASLSEVRPLAEPRATKRSATEETPIER